jgi:hypothetical protein
VANAKTDGSVMFRLSPSGGTVSTTVDPDERVSTTVDPVERS